MNSNYQVLARKYRPKTFDDLLGQDHVVQTLKNSILQGRIAHTFLFVGPRGTGKTSTARILSKALNCPNGPKIDFNPDDEICIEISEGRNLDVMEIDGASNNSVDQIRDLREGIKFSPSSGQFRIYYIDEVHMLSTAAFNALLKTLEEPPSHVKFIFATTEVHKIPVTILSRCQRFDLKRISIDVIANHIKKICKLEKIKIDNEASIAVAKSSDGSMRDSQSMLDQLISFCGNEIKGDDVYNIFGITPAEVIYSLAEYIIKSDTVSALDLVKVQENSGKNLQIILNELMDFFRSLLISKSLENSQSLTSLINYNIDIINELKDLIDKDKIIRILDILIDTNGKLRWSSNQQIIFETAIIKCIQSIKSASINQVIDVISKSLLLQNENIVDENNTRSSNKTIESRESEIKNNISEKDSSSSKEKLLKEAIEIFDAKPLE